MSNGGERLGPNTFMVPKAAQPEIAAALHRQKARFRMLELLRRPGNTSGVS